MKHFEERLRARWEAKSLDLTNKVDNVPEDYLISLEDESEEFKKELNKVISNNKVEDSDDYGDWLTSEDNNVKMELAMRRSDKAEMHYVKAKRRAVDDDGKPQGTPSHNPLLDQRQYEVGWTVKPKS
mmetsp:Transcript_2052/g.2906  ORF Transcript_2052/g.2906 Transcript_2052/m.2906 type:complete len:127 (-) Transcript_2052:295-675(-)